MFKKIIAVFIVSILLAGAVPFSQNATAQQNPEKQNQGINDNLETGKNLIAQQAQLKKLVDKAKTTGRVNVIVGLDVAFTPEGFFKTNQEKINQRQNIVNAQDRLLQDLPFSENNQFNKYKYIPYMSMSINQNALEHLVSSDMVTSIQEDVLEFTTLYDSTGIIDVDPEAFNAGFTGAGKIVAILDTGILSSHPFFSGRVIDQACFTDGSDTSTTPGTGTCPNGAAKQLGTGAGEPCTAPGCYHGTHVAGIAAGNGAAIPSTPSAPASGVAKDADIMSMQVFTTFTSQCGGKPPCVGSWGSDQIEAMVYIFDKHNNDPAFTNKIAALNLSLGGSPQSSVCDGSESARLAAVNNLRSVGIATVASSGNSGTTNGIGAPACISSVVSVGSTTDSDNVSSFSNFDDFLDLLAPGSSITSSLRTSADPNIVVTDPAFWSS